METKAPIKILVVDDEPKIPLLINQAFKRHIQEKQFKFSFAENGQEALDQLQVDNAIEIMLIDLNMPVMDGITLLSCLQQHKTHMNATLTPIVVSAYSDMGNIRKAMNTGAFDFLTKPLDLNDLELTLDKAITHVQQLRKIFEQEQLVQQTLRQAKETAETANRVKNEFLASVSHELRTPLNAVLGMAELLQEEIYGPLNYKQQHALQTIETNGRHLLLLINDILDLSKLEMGKLELTLGPVAIEAVCQTSLLLIQEGAHKKHLKVSYQFDSDVTTIQADSRRLKQILLNLLNNAVKFTPANGAIGLEVTQDDSKQVVCFTVWDTGIGIAQEDMSRLFKPFVQLDARLSREYEGTGVGLALVSELTKMHKGTISVDSTVGHGSRFTISLPPRTYQLT